MRIALLIAVAGLCASTLSAETFTYWVERHTRQGETQVTCFASNAQWQLSKARALGEVHTTLWLYLGNVLRGATSAIKTIDHDSDWMLVDGPNGEGNLTLDAPENRWNRRGSYEFLVSEKRTSGWVPFRQEFRIKQPEDVNDGLRVTLTKTERLIVKLIDQRGGTPASWAWNTIRGASQPGTAKIVRLAFYAEGLNAGGWIRGNLGQPQRSFVVELDLDPLNDVYEELDRCIWSGVLDGTTSYPAIDPVAARRELLDRDAESR